MAVRIKNIVIDCSDAWVQIPFWMKAADLVEDPAYPLSRSNPGGLLRSRDGSLTWLFIRVPEAKTAKNRLHLDLVPAHRSRDEEVEYLIEIGGTVLADHRREDGSGFVLMADPEGNEFCVEAPDC